VHLFHTQEREFYRLDKLWDHDGNLVPLPFDALEA
jgi:ribosomal silencing factor RsfS